MGTIVHHILSVQSRPGNSFRISDVILLMLNWGWHWLWVFPADQYPGSLYAGTSTI